jgi:hypothetical protein
LLYIQNDSNKPGVLPLLVKEEEGKKKNVVVVPMAAALWRATGRDFPVCHLGLGTNTHLATPVVRQNQLQLYLNIYSHVEPKTPAAAVKRVSAISSGQVLVR